MASDEPGRSSNMRRSPMRELRVAISNMPRRVFVIVCVGRNDHLASWWHIIIIIYGLRACDGQQNIAADQMLLATIIFMSSHCAFRRLRPEWTQQILRLPHNLLRRGRRCRANAAQKPTLRWVGGAHRKANARSARTERRLLGHMPVAHLARPERK